MSHDTEIKILTEEIGVRFEDCLNLSPLAARVYALIVLSSYDGLTFEEIKEFTSASKSSTSVNINVLTQLGYITFYTKPGDRKRYFKLSKSSQLQQLSLYQEDLDREMAAASKINDFNQKYHPEKFINEETFGHIYQDYIVEKKQLVQRTLERLKRFRESEK
ncbi:MAG: GbsR/MarR family transcriptional regulator [Nonlabens sp.]|uniref:GbsR/MarR family transcriptional regulator n=1 Tax=Nonlabens sp. TaxID=1888209 RepID=UPI003EF8FE1D